MDAQNSFFQFEIKMNEKEFINLTDSEGPKGIDNKGKVLLTCLDRSGSMSGAPLECVKLGALKLGETLLNGGIERPFERFITMLYDT